MKLLKLVLLGFLIYFFGSCSQRNSKNNDEILIEFLNRLNDKESKEKIIKDYFLCTDTILKNKTILGEIYKGLDSLSSGSYDYSKVQKADSSYVYKINFHLSNSSFVRTKYVLTKNKKIVSINPIAKNEEIIMWFIPCK